MLGLVITG